MSNRSLTTACALGLLLALLAQPVGATQPGPNGELFFTREVDGNGATSPAVLAAAPGGPERVVAEEPGSGIAPKVSPDGREILLWTPGDDLVRQSIAGGPVVTVVDGSASRFADWSPDGTQVIYLDNGAGWSVVGTDGTNPRPLNPATSAGGHDITWSTDGLAYQAEGRRIIRIDPATGGATEIPVSGVQILEDFGLDASPDGSSLVVGCYLDGNADPSVCILGTDGVLRQAISPDERFQRDPLFSPDGTRVAFSMHQPDFTTSDMYSTDLAGGDLQQIVANAQATSWGRVPETPPQPLTEPPPPPSNAPLPCGGVDGDPTTTERADFTDPARYAAAVSQARFGCGSDAVEARHVVLSRDDAFADSLVGAALTGDGPLLFTATGALPEVTATEIGRVLDDGDTVYVLGGDAAVSQAVVDQLTAAGYAVVRLAGPSRVETSVRVAEEVLALGGDADTVAVARAAGPADNPTAGWADSVSSGAWTALRSIPTVVTDTASVHPVVAAFLDTTEPRTTVLLGGTAALSPAVEDAVPGPMRVAGDTRAATAQAIAAQLLDVADEDRTLVVINGYREDGWLFGLPAAGLAADVGAAIALGQDPVPPETMAMACDPSEVEVLLAGGLGVLPPAVPDQLDGAAVC